MRLSAFRVLVVLWHPSLQHYRAVVPGSFLGEGSPFNQFQVWSRDPRLIATVIEQKKVTTRG